jgi:hypothetical protein
MNSYTVVNFTNLANVTATAASASSGAFSPKSKSSVIRLQTAPTAATATSGSVYFNIASAATVTADVNNPILTGESFVNVPARSSKISTCGADGGTDPFQIVLEDYTDGHHGFLTGELITIEGSSVSGYNTYTPVVASVVNSTCITVASTGGALGQGTGGIIRKGYKLAVERIGAVDVKVTATEVTQGG